MNTMSQPKPSIRKTEKKEAMFVFVVGTETRASSTESRMRSSDTALTSFDRVCHHMYAVTATIENDTLARSHLKSSIASFISKPLPLKKTEMCSYLPDADRRKCSNSPDTNWEYSSASPRSTAACVKRKSYRVRSAPGRAPPDASSTYARGKKYLSVCLGSLPSCSGARKCARTTFGGNKDRPRPSNSYTWLCPDTFDGTSVGQAYAAKEWPMAQKCRSVSSRLPQILRQVGSARTSSSKSRTSRSTLESSASPAAAPYTSSKPSCRTTSSGDGKLVRACGFAPQGLALQ
mmetsp:Transcript_57333/g.174587  ORF Transcript_57333/g.174587 Transcript_57333/m.174587 type:complete len:290 (+) Transcript_57333:312-1181(+)